VATGDKGIITTALLGLAQELGAPQGEVFEAFAGRRNPADLLWRFLTAQQGWLLVFDNVDDLDVLTVGGITVAEGAGWIRPTTAGLILVTSRVVDPRAWGRHARKRGRDHRAVPRRARGRSARPGAEPADPGGESVSGSRGMLVAGSGDGDDNPGPAAKEDL